MKAPRGANLSATIRQLMVSQSQNQA